MSAADGRTEKPTPKRLKKARAEGQIAKSAELVSWAGVLAGTLALPVAVRSAGGRMQSLTNDVMNASTRPTKGGALAVLAVGLRDVLAIVAPIGLAAVVFAFVVGTAQMGRPSLGALKPKFNRLSPKAGIKRIVSTHGPLEAVKSLVRLIAIIAVTYPTVKKLASSGIQPQMQGLSPAIAQVASSSLHLLRVVAIIGLVVAGFDYAINKHRTDKSLKMSKQEIRDESRESDGDPATKARRRAMARRMSRHRMMASLSTATAVVVNPTHYAVALTYSPGDPAPKVVAKGVDQVALRIREVAASHGVPIVEDPPLARALHAACEIDQRIPGVLFLATARLLAFVYQLSSLARTYPSVHHTPLSQLPDPALTGRAAA